MKKIAALLTITFFLVLVTRATQSNNEAALDSMSVGSLLKRMSDLDEKVAQARLLLEGQKLILGGTKRKPNRTETADRKAWEKEYHDGIQELSAIDARLRQKNVIYERPAELIIYEQDKRFWDIAYQGPEVLIFKRRNYLAKERYRSAWLKYMFITSGSRQKYISDTSKIDPTVYAKFAEAVTHEECDCEKIACRTLQSLDYDSNGEVLKNADFGPSESLPWRTIIPDTIGEHLFRAVCND